MLIFFETKDYHHSYINHVTINMAESTRDTFNRQWADLVKKQGKNNQSLSRVKYNENVTHLHGMMAPGYQKTVEDRNLLKRFTLVLGDKGNYLAMAKDANEKTVHYFVTNEDLYDTILEAHLAESHRGQLKTYTRLKKECGNVTQSAVNMFIKLCGHCEQKRSRSSKKSLVTNPSRSEDFNSRAQVDLIDMQQEMSVPGPPYKWILNVQDHFTKFIQLRPLAKRGV